MTCRRPRRSFIVCWTNNSADFTPGWKACSAAMAAINKWRSCLVWMWTPSPGAERSCWAAKCCASGCGGWEAAGRRSKKNARNLEPTAAVAATTTRRATRWDGRAFGRACAWSRSAANWSAWASRFVPTPCGVCSRSWTTRCTPIARVSPVQQSPERDRQFRYLQGQRQEFTRQGLPIISVDTKKKELVGPFKNAGRVWSREAIPVNDHDFRSLAKGMAIPRGLYDLQANRGSVLIGTSHDTSGVCRRRHRGLVAPARAGDVTGRPPSC